MTIVYGLFIYMCVCPINYIKYLTIYTCMYIDGIYTVLIENLSTRVNVDFQNALSQLLLNHMY